MISLLKNLGSNSIENGFINRDWTNGNGIHIVTDSEYVKYFEGQVCHTIPTDNVIHYLIMDNVDTGIEILANSKPILINGY